MNEERPGREEWIKFGGLVAVLLGVVLTVSLARPLVFQQVVPALLGDFLRAETMMPAASPLDIPAPAPDPDLVVPTAPPEGSDAIAPNSAFPVTAPKPAPKPASEPEAVPPVGAPAEPPASPMTTAPETAAPETALTEPSALPANAALTAVDAETLVHVVQRGENLIQIARNYGVSLEAILALNPVRDPNRILVGDSLRIPRP